MADSTKKLSNRIAQLLIALYAAIALAAGWQWLGGAYHSEFGGHPDEAAHYVTGLFVRDAIGTLPQCVMERSLKPLAPFKGKEGDFYQHYPKVALGVWPPAFYLTQSAWTFPFGVSRLSVMLLMATLSAGTAVLIFRALQAEFGLWSGIAGAVLWLCSPLIRESYGMVMAETLSALTMLGATLCWGAFLDQRRTRDAVLFGLLASAAILTKGTGLALVFMCCFSLAFTGNWKAFTWRGTWIAILIVALLAGPWTWFFRNEGTKVGGWADNSGGLSLAFTAKALVFYGKEIATSLGVAVAAFALAGMGGRAFTASEHRGRWASLSALVIGVYIFQCLVPVGFEARHIVSATPALVMLAIAGAHLVARSTPSLAKGGVMKSRDAQWVLLLVLLTLPLQVIHLAPKGYSGFQALAMEVLRDAKPGARILVCSDARGEGMFISEIAMRDRRPNLLIERASTSLVDEKSRKWDGSGMRERFLDDDALLDYLVRGNIEYIVLDAAIPDDKHADYHDQLKRVVTSNAGAFWKIGESPIMRENEPLLPPLRLYRVMRRVGEIVPGAQPIPVR